LNKLLSATYENSSVVELDEFKSYEVLSMQTNLWSMFQKSHNLKEEKLYHVHPWVIHKLDLWAVFSDIHL
jgi:hypothetical protein